MGKVSPLPGGCDHPVPEGRPKFRLHEEPRRFVIPGCPLPVAELALVNPEAGDGRPGAARKSLAGQERPKEEVGVCPVPIGLVEALQFEKDAAPEEAGWLSEPHSPAPEQGQQLRWLSRGEGVEESSRGIEIVTVSIDDIGLGRAPLRQ
jgi:hypothetical protein